MTVGSINGSLSPLWRSEGYGEVRGRREGVWAARSRHSGRRQSRRSVAGLLHGKIVEEALHRRPEWRDIVPDRSPDDRLIDPEIGVDQFVTHTGHFAPGERRGTVPDLPGDALRRLADHFQCSYDCVDSLVVPGKLLIGYTG